MRASRKMGWFLTASSLMLLLSGCSAPEVQVGAIESDGALSGNLGGSVDRQGSSVARRFEDAAPQSRTAVESAMELLEKHAALSKQVAELERKNHGLITENDQQKEQVIALETELKQAQKELGEANDLLIEMRIELNNWKTNILGFRSEMREAETAQLEALLTILKILGGEVTVESAQIEDAADAATAGTSSYGPDQAKAQGTPEPGEPNG